MIYFFDTNVILAYIRQTKVADAITAVLSLTANNQVHISIVTVGELWSIAQQNNWGLTKRNKLQHLLDNYSQINLVDDEIVIRYAEIDAFSQNKLAGFPLGNTARNMGKNDLWIAASASLSGATLITTDKDFDHLHRNFLEIIWINPNA